MNHIMTLLVSMNHGKMAKIKIVKRQLKQIRLKREHTAMSDANRVLQIISDYHEQRRKSLQALLDFEAEHELPEIVGRSDREVWAARWTRYHYMQDTNIDPRQLQKQVWAQPWLELRDYLGYPTREQDHAEPT